MRGTTVAALVLLLLPPIGYAQRQRQASEAAIEGQVVRADSGEPVSRARVTLQADAPGPAAAVVAVTDDRGRFVFAGLTAGTYRIAAARNGFVRQQYGQRLPGGTGAAITIADGEIRRGVAFQLLPAGNVSGEVRDAFGEPMPGLYVQLLKAAYNATGQRSLQAQAVDRTDDRGSYRLFGVAPGRYYVAVSAAAQNQALLGGPGSPNDVADSAYPTTYYPGVVDASDASMVDVPSGTDLSGVDFVLRELALFRVRGRVIDPVTGQPPSSASVTLVRRGLVSSAAGQIGSGAIYRPDGTFEVRGIPSGSYWVRANVAGNSADAVVPPRSTGRALTDVFLDTLFSERQVAQTVVDIFDADVEGLELALGAGVSIRGRVRVEGSGTSGTADLTQLQVALRPALSGMLVNPGGRQPLARDGSYVLDRVLPGEYRVAAQPLPADYYIKDARLGQTDVLGQPVHVTGQEAGLLNIVLSGAAGRVDGLVIDARRLPVPGAEAVLVPAEKRARVDLYRSVATDETGRFSLRSIPPGNYQVFAWVALEPFSYLEPDFLRRFEQHGQHVSVVERSRVDVEVRVIPIDLR